MNPRYPRLIHDARCKFLKTLSNIITPYRTYEFIDIYLLDNDIIFAEPSLRPDGIFSKPIKDILNFQGSNEIWRIKIKQAFNELEIDWRQYLNV